MNIDDIADDKVSTASPGEKFHEQWLDDLPTGQWPSYIDESAQLVADGIFIGETNLTKADFGPETGSYYQNGLASTSDVDLKNTSLPIGNHSARDIGKIAWCFNRLREDIRKSQYTDFENPSRAIEAAVNKALVESINRGDIAAEEIETIRLPESATVSTLVSEVFCRPRNETYVEMLLETVKTSGTSGLLQHLDEPRMVTPLWDHQLQALDSWLSNNCRGYVDMATATGKTVLGLAAIAHHFGALHPQDQDFADTIHQPDDERRSTVLVVAHRSLILDQWKREFDIHLNIPEQRSTQDGAHTIEFEWGDVHFWTPDRLQQAGVPDTDLVVLDETHHYLGSSGFGEILDEVEGHVLALSGSLDDANARTLERRNIPKLFEFSLRDGQKAGIIPQCDWDVVFTPYEAESQLAEVTSRCADGIAEFSSGVEVPNGTESDAEQLQFENLSEARSLAQSTAGREIKEENPEFREFTSAVMARQMTQYNLSPSLSTVVRLTLDNVDEHKCVVLLESGDEIDKVTVELQSQLGDAYSSFVTVFDTDTDLSAIEKFDEEQESGALIGLASTLGEGIDIETADVCINRGRGRLSRSLVQRMGRILRNPDGDKHAQFFHVSGLPIREDSTLKSEDGVALLETASQLLAWGEQFHARPIFAIDTETALTEYKLAELERAGADAINEWSPDHYDWPSDNDIRTNLEMLLSRLGEIDGSALLSIERQEREDRHQRGTEVEAQYNEATAADALEFVAADENSIEVGAWLVRLADAASDTRSTEAFIEESVRSYAQETFSSQTLDVVPDTEATREVTLNPALDAVVSAYAGTESREATVHAAIANRLANEVDSLSDQINSTLSEQEIRNRINQLTHNA